MSYFEDLSNYCYCCEIENSKNIGWLDADYSFSKGKVSEEFIDKLWLYLKVDLNIKRGIHICNLCHKPHHGIFIASRNGESLKLGFAEIRVLSEDCNVVFAAPTLIYHYILDHGYKPPEEFIQAVLNGPKPGTTEYKKFLVSFKKYTLYGKNMKGINITLWGEATNNIKIINEFHNAIKEGSLERIVELSDLGEEWTNKCIPSSKWIYIAAAEGQYEIVKYMISSGVELDVSEITTNPLFGAINGGYINIVKLLIESKIDSSVKYNNEFFKDMDALAFARKKGKAEIVELLQSTFLEIKDGNCLEKDKGGWI